MGADLEDLLPLRIAYQPGTVLEIVPMSASYAPGSFRNAKTSDPHQQPIIPNIQTPELIVSGSVSTDTNYPRCYSGVSSDVQSSFLTYRRLYGRFLEEVRSGQELQTANIKNSLELRFDRLQLEMNKNQSLQEEVHRMQKEKQNEILEMQRQTFNQLAVMQNRFLAIFTQNYELHEYPIPRLFIILPKPQRRRDNLTGFVAQQFRLFFLCECGTHTMTETSKTKHEIHLAKHGGYDISRPTKFFEKFGPRILKVLQWLRYGVIVAGFLAPPLAHLRLADGICGIRDDISYVDNDIGPMLDHAISFLETQLGTPGNSTNINVTLEHTERRGPEALEGADLRQLESYLKVNDRARSLANLYRIVTSEGHVKWVCIDHYRESYQESVTQRLRDLVDAAGGEFAEEEGKVTVKILSKTQAKQFYTALVNSRRVHELDIALQWDVSLDDFRAFSDAMTRANIVHLKLDGSHIKRAPVIDAINRSRRYDPLLQLLSNGRIQSLELDEIKDFNQRLSTSALAPLHHIRHLSICSKTSSCVSSTLLSQILESCTRITKLRVTVASLYEPAQEIARRMAMLPNLSQVEIQAVHGRMMKIQISHGRAIAMWISIDEPGIMGVIDSLPTDQLATLDVRVHRSVGYSQETEKGLSTIIRASPSLTHLSLTFYADRYVSILGSVQTAREDGLITGLVYQPLQILFHVDGRFSDAETIGVILAQLPSGRPNGEDGIPITSLSLGRHEPDHSGVIQGHGLSFKEIRPNFEFRDEDAELLDKASGKDSSQLEVLVLDTSQLSHFGLDCLDRVIARSTRLKRLGFYIPNLEAFSQQVKALRLLKLYGTKVNVLGLGGRSVETWLPALQGLYPTKASLPALHTLELYNTRSKCLPTSCIQWICALISAPPRSPPSTSVPQLMVSIPGRHSNVKVIHDLGLRNLVLAPESWKTVLSALDFSVLRKLNLSGSNITLTELEHLVECISGNDDPIAPLKELSVTDTELTDADNEGALE
ncbi:hypothetical protein BGZ98_006893 [Dissophora globulifera]|nr:hypothetical protein BGZ98_006893 [Dissophora globulifera]